jgi:ParB-like chromosome segregation protein Spo0J
MNAPAGKFTGTEISVADVVFREDMYPRIETSAVTVQKYAEDLDVLPPIEVNQHNELIDGWHRWTAHKKNGTATIRVIVTETASDAELLELAIERNAAHGLQLSQQDKQDMARRIYNGTPEAERDDKKKRLAKILAVSERTLRDWLSRIDKDSKAARDRKIFEMWLACHTHEEIAEAVSAPKRTVTDLLGGLSENGNSAETAQTASEDDDTETTAFKLSKSELANADHASGFDPMFYNIWKQQTKTEGSKHPGNSEVRWLDNLLYSYTNPFDIVVDPFAGGGSTIDICKKRFRRYLVSDRKPVVEREKEIRAHDLTEGLLKPPSWKDVALVYLDPPYWKQAEGKYSEDPTDLANMDLAGFNTALAGIINAYAKKLDTGYIALIIQPTQWKAPEKQFTDHVGDMLRLVKLPVDMRFSVPYESQQCTPQMVEWAKANKKYLVLTREIVVWKVG